MRTKRLRETGAPKTQEAGQSLLLKIAPRRSAA